MTLRAMQTQKHSIKTFANKAGSDNYPTPPWLIDSLDAEFHLTVMPDGKRYDPREGEPMKDLKAATAHFYTARSEVIAAGYGWEIEVVERREFAKVTPWEFFQQYVFVVLSTGMKNQVADKMYRIFFESGRNPATIGHPKKREAVTRANKEYREWFERLSQAKDKLAVIASLPFIGPKTKFHLARNLGFLEYAKPDRHLERLAAKFGYDGAQQLCDDIGEQVGKKAGVVDVILWRCENLRVIAGANS